MTLFPELTTQNGQTAIQIRYRMEDDSSLGDGYVILHPGDEVAGIEYSAWLEVIQRGGSVEVF